MQPSLCGKIVHFNFEAAETQSSSLGDKYGKSPNIYRCERCIEFAGVDIWHVGYGTDGVLLSKKARRHRKHASRKKRKRRRNY